MQVEYKFVTWEGNPDRAAWMVDQVADYLNAMRNGLDEIVAMMNDAAAGIPKREQWEVGFASTIHDVGFVEEAVGLVEEKVRARLTAFSKRKAEKTKAERAAKKSQKTKAARKSKQQATA